MDRINVTNTSQCTTYLPPAYTPSPHFETWKYNYLTLLWCY